MSVYALRLENSTDTAARVRMADLLGMAPGSTALNARGGVRPGPFAADVAVTAGTMQVKVQPFLAFVPGSVSAPQGGYPFVCDSQVTITLSDGHATLGRIDTIVAQVRDNAFDASGFVDARVLVLQGTPASSPVPPSLPANTIALRDVSVPAGLSAGNGGLSAGNLSTDRRTYAVALGAIAEVKDAAERDAIPAPRPGRTVFRRDTQRLETYTGTAWRAFDGKPIKGAAVTTIGGLLTGTPITGVVSFTGMGFTTPPVVVVGLANPASNAPQNFAVAVTGVTATQCTLLVTRIAGAAASADVAWIAVSND